MARDISKSESWERAYQAYSEVNFSAFDYDTIKASLIEYLRTYHAETFNDYIESSEFIALLELFAYLSELIAYRVDMNAHENFMTVAQRKQSVLRLAAMLSYKATRNIPARGLVAIDSITTTEAIYDSRGVNLANSKIIWNDPNNVNWKEQFLLIMNRVMQQEFGSVVPSDRVQVDDVLFELYALNNNDFPNGVLSFNVTANGSAYPMELVPVVLESNGPVERRPGLGSSFTIMYGSDGLGDASPLTGFFMLAKQGKLQKISTQFDGKTPNQTYEVAVNNINDPDVWLNQIDSDTGAIISNIQVDGLGRQLGALGEWNQITKSGIENVIFNTDLYRNKYDIETLEDDQIRIVFGDGEFSDIPGGRFDIWYRTSANENLIIPKNSIQNKFNKFTYVDDESSVQTFTFSFSGINTITNASATEDIERIRKYSPAVYSTQNRMVNGFDYNTFLLQDPSIVRLRAVNRTFAGDSKYNAWFDASNHYQDVKMFSDDGILFYKDRTLNLSANDSMSTLTIIREYIQPLLNDVQVMTYHISNNIEISGSQFNTTELQRIIAAYDDAELNDTFPVLVSYWDNNNADPFEWFAYPSDGSKPTNAVVTFSLQRDTGNAWEITYNTTRIVFESPTTKFWFHNDSVSTIVDETLNSQLDLITLLKANVHRDRNAIFDNEIDLAIVGGEVEQESPDLAQPNVNQLELSTLDVDGDGVPDDLSLTSIIDRHEYSADNTIGVKTLSFSYLIDLDMVKVFALDVNGDVISQLEQYVDYYEYDTANTQSITNSLLGATAGGTSTYDIEIVNVPVGTVTFDYVRVDYVYYQKVETESSSTVVYVGSSDVHALAWYTDPDKDDDELFTYARYRGRDQFNFAWMHRSPRGHLIDPSPTNIIDMFLVTRGYYQSMLDWVELKSQKPTKPTPLQLRSDYGELIKSKMLSDTVIPHSAEFKVLFGPYSSDELRAKFLVVRSSNSTKTDNEIKVVVVNTIRAFFDIQYWEFGETFNFTELASQIHANLVSDIKSVVLVPLKSNNYFGDMFQVIPREDELFLPNVSVDDIEIVQYLNQRNLRQIR